jgi:hypothetical protein
VAADHFTATRAFPRLFLAVKELFNSVVFDEIQVLYHAHSVARSVPAVNGSQSIAWKTAAFKTETDFIICQFGTVFFQKRTFLVSWPAAGAVRYSDAFVFNVIRVG